MQLYEVIIEGLKFVGVIGILLFFFWALPMWIKDTVILFGERLKYGQYPKKYKLLSLGLVFVANCIFAVGFVLFWDPFYTKLFSVFIRELALNKRIISCIFFSGLFFLFIIMTFRLSQKFILNMCVGKLKFFSKAIYVLYGVFFVSLIIGFIFHDLLEIARQSSNLCLFLTIWTDKIISMLYFEGAYDGKTNHNPIILIIYNAIQFAISLIFYLYVFFY